MQGWYKAVTAAGVMAVRQNRIGRIVLISSLGAGASDNLGTITYVGEMEIAFNKLNANVLALRPGYFMENFLLQVHHLRNSGQFHFPYAPDHDIPFISADDIGNTAATYLLDENWAGHWTLNMMGPENITLQEAAKRLSVALDRPIQYNQTSWYAVGEQLTEWGLNETVHQEMLDLLAALGDPNGIYATPRTPEANTPTDFESFIANKLVSMLA